MAMIHLLHGCRNNAILLRVLTLLRNILTSKTLKHGLFISNVFILHILFKNFMKYFLIYHIFLSIASLHLTEIYVESTKISLNVIFWQDIMDSFLSPANRLGSDFH